MEPITSIYTPQTHDARLYKICVIEDLFKIKYILHEMGNKAHDDVINEPSALFDHYYDLDTEALEVQLAYLSHMARQMKLAKQ